MAFSTLRDPDFPLVAMCMRRSRARDPVTAWSTGSIEASPSDTLLRAGGIPLGWLELIPLVSSSREREPRAPTTMAHGGGCAASSEDREDDSQKRCG
jgi:hypothetical protein